MALLDFGSPPEIKPSSHRDYLPWMAHRCFDRACAYCQENGRVLEVDHVEPESLAPKRKRDPTNLVPACATCNGPTGKWDYHPAQVPRKKCPDDDHGYLALDPRNDDLARLFEVLGDGRLEVKPGPEQGRARWNRDVLFRLNRTKLRDWRKQAQDLLTVAEHLVEVVKTAGSGATAEAVRRRDVMVREVALRLVFFELFELPLSPDLLSLATAVRDAERGPRPA